jgi:hypothetical protein
MLELWDGPPVVTMGRSTAAPRTSREAVNLRALRPDHALFERDCFTRGDQHVEVDR